MKHKRDNTNKYKIGQETYIWIALVVILNVKVLNIQVKRQRL